MRNYELGAALVREYGGCFSRERSGSVIWHRADGKSFLCRVTSSSDIRVRRPLLAGKLDGVAFFFGDGWGGEIFYSQGLKSITRGLGKFVGRDFLH